MAASTASARIATVHAFNFVAAQSEEGQDIVEGRILARLLEKLEQMREVLADRVFDVIGEVLSLNDVNLPDILREAAHDPRRLQEYLDRIEKVDPQLLLHYEKATGIALARANVDFSGFQRANVEADERRLMPRYVEDQFVKSCAEVGLKIEPRADGLWRVEHVLADLRSDRLESVRRLGKSEPAYRKLTFHKEHLENDQHLDAVLFGPGHPLYAAVDERLNEKLAPLLGAMALYLDVATQKPYRLHFFEISIRGQNTKGDQQTLFAELVAVRENLSIPLLLGEVGDHESRYQVVPADCLLDLPAFPNPPEAVGRIDPAPAADFLKGTYQSERRQACQDERKHFVEVSREYLQKSYTARQRAAQDRVMSLRAREKSDASVAIARQRAENDLTDLQRTHKERMAGLDRLSIARHGPVRHIATALVLPASDAPKEVISELLDDLDPELNRQSELAAENVVIAYETARGWETERVGHLKIGFDVRSLGPADIQTGYRDPVTSLRRIEVKGRKRGQTIRLTTNEWYKAVQLGDSYWLYVVWDPLGKPDATPLMIQNPVKAHAERLTQETGKPVTVADILAGRAPRPRVLDMFAGGGAIPLEALRLGCEAYALDLNPVAHIIQLCTLVYPQKYGKPDQTAAGSSKDGTWAGLAAEVETWGNWVLSRVKVEIGDLYPVIPDPEASGDELYRDTQETMGFAKDTQQKLRIARGLLTPVAYLWTRTVTCKNPTCRATVPLVKQTWLCKKESRCVALKLVAPKGQKSVRFKIVEGEKPANLGFDPEAFSKGGNATCPFCVTVADSDHTKAEGCEGRIGEQLMAVVCIRPGKRGKIYVAADDVPLAVPNGDSLQRRSEQLCAAKGMSIPSERIVNDAKNANFCILYGLKKFSDLFNPRQTLALLTFIGEVRAAEEEMSKRGLEAERRKAIVTYLGLVVDRVAMFGNRLCAWYYQEQAVSGAFGRQSLPMLWDYGEVALGADISGGIGGGISRIVDTISAADEMPAPATVVRGQAQNASQFFEQCDAVITDPPYYDNIPYANLADFFYVWLKRTVGHLYPEHFGSEGTPKKPEAVADATRHGGSRQRAKEAYELSMAQSFIEAHRVLKHGGPMVVVYAHKTTLGWATLVEALRRAAFTVTEAWPLDTEGPGRLRARDSSALASSIFLVARKRDEAKTGNYDEHVRPELDSIVRERVETLWDMGISGADLVIASVGAGLRAFTRFARVEYANGEEVPAERFLTEVETVVLETILTRLSKEVGGKGTTLAGLDAATRFYILWRYTYRTAELEAGEAIIFANGTHVELDGQHSVTSGTHALVSKKKGKYALSDFAERGEDEHLGLPSDAGQPPPLVDVLHRTLWLMEKRPTELPVFLRDSQVNREQLRLVAQALAGPALKGGELGDVSPTAELSALGKLTANWQGVVEDAALTPGQREEKKVGQKQLI